jgi:hypothetical protein
MGHLLRTWLKAGGTTPSAQSIAQRVFCSFIADASFDDSMLPTLSFWNRFMHHLGPNSVYA